MWRTANSTGIEPIQIEPNGCGGADVWLRKNIEQTTDEDGNPQWVADETHGLVSPVPTLAEIGASFDAWWADLEERGKTDADRMAELTEASDQHETALVELAGIAAENAVTIEDVMSGLLEIAAIVGGE